MSSVHAADQPIHDVKPRRRRLNFFQCQAWVHADVRRVVCGKCGKTTRVVLLWACQGSGFTDLMKAFMVALCREMLVAAVARLLGISDNRVGRVLDFHVDAARAREDYASVRAVAVGERSARPGRRYGTVSHDTSARCVLFALPSRENATFAKFSGNLAGHGGDAKAIKTVSVDLAKAYRVGTRAHCSNARLCVDPVHVVALAHQALKQVRRQQEGDLKGTRSATLKNPADWIRNRVNAIHHVQHSILKTGLAWRLKKAVRAVFRNRKDAEMARQAMTAVVSWARRSRLAPFKRFGATLRDHLEGVLKHFRCGSPNGYAEAMNGLTNAAKRRARGYGTDWRLITICHLLGEKLKHLPVNSWLHHTAATR